MAIERCYRCEIWIEDDEAHYIEVQDEPWKVPVCENCLTEKEYEREFAHD
jgi:hypothetical protein